MLKKQYHKAPAREKWPSVPFQDDFALSCTPFAVFTSARLPTSTKHARNTEGDKAHGNGRHGNGAHGSGARDNQDRNQDHDLHGGRGGPALPPWW